MPALVKRSGHVAGSSARDVVVASVKSTLGEAVVQPRSMLPCTVADIASIACPGLLLGDGAGQSNDPPVKCSRPSMVVRLKATSPVEVKPSISRTGPLTTAWLRRIEYPPGLCSCAWLARRLPSLAPLRLTAPPLVRRPSRLTSPSTIIALQPNTE